MLDGVLFFPVTPFSPFEVACWMCRASSSAGRSATCSAARSATACRSVPTCSTMAVVRLARLTSEQRFATVRGPLLALFGLMRSNDVRASDPVEAL